MNDRELVTQLKIATENLIWMSEADYPWQAFLWEDRETLSPEQILTKLDLNFDTPIAIEDLDEFFAPATQVQEWHNEEEAREVKQYQQLVNLLQTNLTDLKVYRFGNTEIDIYIVGKTESGNLAGLSTKVIET